MGIIVTEATLINVKQLAAMLSISVRHAWRMKADGQLPEVVKFRGSVRWRLRDVKRWIELGCPSQEEFAKS